MIFFNQGMLLLVVSAVKAVEVSEMLPPKCSTNNKEMTKDTEGTVEIGNSKDSCDQFIASGYTLRTVNHEIGVVLA